MSNTKQGSSIPSEEEVYQELTAMLEKATNPEISPVAIFTPLVKMFDWVPTTEEEETSTIVLASHYGDIDNGCIIYNPEFIHTLYTENDYGTFYAIIATMGLGVQCGYYSYRNGEGSPHSAAVKLMMGHIGIFNKLKGNNPEFNESVEALQQAFENPIILNRLKATYAKLNVVNKDDPNDPNGGFTTTVRQFDDDDENWNL